MPGRVLFISGTAAISGAEHVLADYIRRSRYKKDMALAASSPEKVRSFYSGLGVPVFYGSCLDQEGAAAGGPLRAAKKALNFVKSFKFIREALSKAGADVIVGNNTGDVIYSLPGKAAGAVHFNFMHDVIKKDTAQAFAVRLFDRHVLKYIAVCNAVRDSIIALGISAAKVSVIYNGIEAGKKPGRMPGYGGALRVGFAGSIEARKNPMEYMDFISALGHAGVKTAGIIAAGNTPDEKLLAAVRNRAEAMKNVKIAGPVERKKMAGFYRKLDLLAVTSSGDALPTVILEAFAAAVPVLGRRTGGIPEMVSNGNNGFLYGNSAEFAGIAHRISAMGKKGLKKAGLKAYDSVRKKFSMKAKVEKTDMILFGRKPGRG